MNIFIGIIMCIIALSASVCADDDTAIPKDIVKLLASHEIVRSEEGELPHTEEVYDLARFIAMNWKQVLPHMSELDPQSQSLIVTLAGVLPPHDYVTFLNTLCDLRIQGKVDKAATLSILVSDAYKEQFLEYNYDVPEVAQVLRKLETIMNKDYPSWNGFLSDAKSGDLKKAIIKGKADGEYDSLPESYAENPDSLYKHLIEHAKGKM